MAFELHPACADVRIVDAKEGRVECIPPRKKVSLIGFGSNTRALAPWTDPTHELWAMNQAYLYMSRRADRWFELHRPEHTPDMRDPAYMDWLKACPVPVYMQDVYEEIPSSVRFPIDRLIAHFHLDYFTSSVAFMLALAIMEGFEEIHVYGIDLITDEEYQVQKPCVEWWMGVAAGRGITLYVPPESALCKQAFRYGYEVAAKFGGIDLNYAVKLVEEHTGKQQDALRMYHTHSGALQMARHFYSLVESASRGGVVTQPFGGRET